MILNSFEKLAQLGSVKEYGEAFRKATGVALSIVPAGNSHAVLGREQNAFCALMFQTLGGCRACSQAEEQVLRQAAQKEAAQQFHCFAGLTLVTVPIMVEGRHRATLLSGQVLRREPSSRDFVLIAKMLGDGLSANMAKKLRQAYFATPVITAERFQSIVKLLALFAQQVGEIASRQALAMASAEPQPVALAKEFLKSHAEQETTLAQVAWQAHVSSFYLCKLFKKTTGMTFTEYLARIRIEKAKALLLNPMTRISEVVYAAGFGSIPQFNSLFKRYVGMPPREYRQTMHTRLNS